MNSTFYYFGRQLVNKNNPATQTQTPLGGLSFWLGILRSIGLCAFNCDFGRKKDRLQIVQVYRVNRFAQLRGTTFIAISGDGAKLTNQA